MARGLRVATFPRQRDCSASLIFLSVLYWLRAYTAQIAAGIQPMIVICRIRQMMPAIGRPMVKKPSQGSSKAMSRRMGFAFTWKQSGQFTPRSEEHTSELQSLMRISYAVFCLKKKNRNNHQVVPKRD